MSTVKENIKETESLQEKIIITDKPLKELNILDIDLEKCTKKELEDFERKDLLKIAEKEEIYKGIKNWKIARFTKSQIVKDLLKNVKKEPFKNEAPQGVEIEKNTNENALNMVLLQSAIIDIITKKDASNLDLFCQETLKNNDSELIDEQTALKIQNSLIKFSMAHLMIRGLGGYKNLFEKGKELFKKIKEKRAEKK